MSALRPWAPGITVLLGLAVLTVGAFVLPGYSGWRFALGCQLSVAGAYLIGRGQGRRAELVRIGKIIAPLKALLQQAEANHQAAERYAAARARGPQ